MRSGRAQKALQLIELMNQKNFAQRRGAAVMATRHFLRSEHLTDGRYSIAEKKQLPSYH